MVEENNHAFLMALKKKFLLGVIDVLIIAWLKEKPLSGQEIMARITAEYGISVSAGTLYPILFSLQRKGSVSICSMKKESFISSLPKESLSVKNWPLAI